KRINNFPEFINLPHQSAQFIARPAFKDFATEHAEQVYVNIVKRVHGINGQLRDNSASARVDLNQMPTFQNQQGLTDRTTADVEFTRHFQFLNTLPRLQVTDHDPLADMLGNLLCKTLWRLKSHTTAARSTHSSAEVYHSDLRAPPPCLTF